MLRYPFTRSHTRHAAVSPLLGLDIKSWGSPAALLEDIPSSFPFIAARDSSSRLKSLINLLIFLKQPHSNPTYNMPGGGVMPITGTADVSRVEAPVTLRAYLIVAFAAFGGIFFGYDTGWMGGVLNM
jgi:hypothetical protein